MNQSIRNKDYADIEVVRSNLPIVRAKEKIAKHQYVTSSIH